jgi:predicted outer membrane repeat protein
MPAPASPRAGSDPRPAAPRLRLECLEDRVTPATFTVNTTLDELAAGDGKLSLREAIFRSNVGAGADVIVVPAGVYRITIPGANEDGNLSGDLDIRDGVTIQGAGAGLTVIDAQQLDRVFDVIGPAPSFFKVVLQGLTVRGGKVTGDGGGIRVGNADLVVRDSVLAGNRASLSGGGISNPDAPGTGNVTLARTTVAHNAAGTSGGGLALLGVGSTLAVNSSTVRRNTATSFAGGISGTTVNLTNSTVSGNVAGSNGGGIFATTATVTGSTVSGNTASGSNGGGGLIASTVNLTNSTVSGNVTTGSGGGISGTTVNLTNSTVSGNTAGGAGGGGQATGTATATNSTVSGNVASGFAGGGIDAGTVNLTNSTVSGNTAVNSGGGIFATTATLLNCTVAENFGQNGGGLFHAAGGAFNLKNTIVALNLVDFTGAGPDVSGAFATQGHNLIGDGTGGTGFTNLSNGDMVGTGANPINPRLGPLAANGGRTKTMALLAGSPAIDKGDNTNAPPTDQRGFGFPRKKDGNGDGIAVVDIGAFER